jgi:DNA invertase Pin-like site-specific DNA recombinase
MPKAYSYLRFSTPRQEWGDSLRRQTSLAQKYVMRHPELVLDTTFNLHDRGVSGFHGANSAEGKLRVFLQRVKAGEVEQGSYLLVENLDRVSRQTARKALRVLEDIVEAGVTLVTLRPERVYTEEALNDPYALLEVIFDFIRANQESERKSLALRDTWEGKRAAGLRRTTAKLTRVCPGWIRWDEDGGRFVLREDRAEVVRRIFALAEQGVGPYSIASALNAEGALTFNGGKAWHAAYISQTLRNKAAIGIFTPHSTETVDKVRGPGKTRKRIRHDDIPNYYPAVVEEDLFQRVQILREASSSPRRGRHAGKPITNIFGGVLRCERCGAAVQRISRGRNKARLVCGAAKHGGGCKFESLIYADMEALLLRRSPELLATAPAGDDAADEQLQRAEAALGGVEDALRNLLEEVERGGGSHTITTRRIELEAERTALEKQVRDTEDRRDAVAGAMVRRRLAELADTLGAEDLDRTRANTLLRQVFEEITLQFSTGRLVFKWVHGGETEVPYEARGYGFEAEPGGAAA